MKKLVFQTNDMKIAGGVERVVSLWANYFSKYINYEVIIATEDGNKSFYNLNKKIKLDRYHYLSNIKFLPFIRILKTYKFLKKFNRNDVIIFNKYIPTHSIFLLRKCGLFKDLKLVYFAHGGTSQFIDFYKSYQSKKIFAAYDKIICLYDDLKEKNKLIKREKISIIGNPISIEIEGRANIRSTNIIAVGRLVKGKGFEKLIESWRKIEGQLSDWNLIIVGSGIEENNLKRLRDKYKLEKRIRFIPAQKDIKKYYKNASILAMPSEFEGLPMVTLEALEAGLPIVSYNIDGNRELISDNGILVERYNTDEFAEALLSLATDYDKRNYMSKKSKQYSLNYKIEERVKYWSEILNW